MSSSSDVLEGSHEFVVTSVMADSTTPFLMVSQAMQPVSAAGAGAVVSAHRKNSIDLSTQIDRDLDDEIMKIFHKAKVAFMHLQEHYERLVNELSMHACTLTNQVVLQHSSVRKIYLQVNFLAVSLFFSI